MKVYRFETSCGEGMYSAGLVHEIQDKTEICLYSPPACPAPWREGEFESIVDRFKLKHGDSEVVFGFQSKAALRRWMQTPKAIRAAAEVGLKLSVYEVDKEHVATSETQCIFPRSKAELLEALEPCERF